MEQHHVETIHKNSSLKLVAKINNNFNNDGDTTMLQQWSVIESVSESMNHYRYHIVDRQCKQFSTYFFIENI